jgi:ABC-type tungstate transport system permease subunit
MELINWIISEEGQELIGDFTDKLGNRLFIPLAGK